MLVKCEGHLILWRKPFFPSCVCLHRRPFLWVSLIGGLRFLAGGGGAGREWPFLLTLHPLASVSNETGGTAGCLLHIVLAEEARPHASLISDYDCSMFNSSCTAISQPRGRRIIVFSKWLSANTAHRCAAGLISFGGDGEEKVLLLIVTTGTDEVHKMSNLEL